MTTSIVVSAKQKSSARGDSMITSTLRGEGGRALSRRYFAGVGVGGGSLGVLFVVGGGKYVE